VELQVVGGAGHEETAAARNNACAFLALNTSRSDVSDLNSTILRLTDSPLRPTQVHRILNSRALVRRLINRQPGCRREQLGQRGRDDRRLQ
jgi:hypothetical protein